jgi:two-component system, response regulator PdtaR
MRVLVVDDSELARTLITRILRAHGMEVCGEAVDGQDALERAQATHPDLVILDFLMPRKDGLQAARELRKLWPSIQIVLNTLYLTDQLRQVAEAAGVRHVVSKSNIESLLKIVESIDRTPAH